MRVKNRSKHSIKVAARQYLKEKDPKSPDINSFLTYLHEEYEPESTRKSWIQAIEFNNVEGEVKSLFEEKNGGN